jgi:hypothetical protein
MSRLIPLEKEGKLEHRTITHIQVSVGYHKGGRNWFNGQEQTSGVFVNVTPVKVEDGFVIAGLGNGVKFNMLPLARNSKKKVAEVSDKVQKQIDEESGVVWNIIQAEIAKLEF